MKKLFILSFLLLALVSLNSCESKIEKERRTGHEWTYVPSEAAHDTHNPDCKYCKARIHREIIETADSLFNAKIDSVLRAKGLN